MPLEKLSRARIVEALNLLGRLAEKEGADRFYPHVTLTPRTLEILAGVLAELERGRHES